MKTVFHDDLDVNGYMVMYIGNVNKAMTAQNRVTWWIVPGTLEV
jgi:hypothetical protein